MVGQEMAETVLLHPGKSWIAGVLHCLVVAWCLPLAAQTVISPRSPEKESPTSAETKEILPRRVEEVQPATYYLKDKQGNLQAVPNFTLDEFEELYKLKNHLRQGDSRPRFSL